MSESGPAPLLVRVGSALLDRGWRLVSAESCTGGLLAARLTEMPGSSNWFEGAFVTYRLSAKTAMVGVPKTLLDRHGAVSEPTARAMAEGALAHSDADVSVAITGVAGPDGGDVLAPVGTVWFAWAVRENGIRCVQTAEHHLAGSRQVVREQAVEVALRGILELL
ncbi:MAG TPA: CinA family protein [Pseudomonadales bacterium]